MERTLLKVVCVFGTRPEAIKMMPLVMKLREVPSMEVIVCVTAQHREQLDSVLSFFEIVPEYDLNIMETAQSLSGIVSKCVGALEEVYRLENPDLVLVHGDTITTFVASLAAFFQQIPIGHVEAGLRTRTKYAPFPEEMDRQLTGVLADLHFAPTPVAEENLVSEGKDRNSIYVTGNTVIDVLAYTISDNYHHPVLDEIPPSHRIIFLTSHRRESWGRGLQNIFEAAKQIITEFQDVEVIYPVHLNPAVRKTAFEILAEVDRIHLLAPLDVIDAHNFMMRSYLVLTDSGGIQEESTYLGKPCMVLRDTTERPEGMRSGSLRLVGTNKQKIVAAVRQLLTDPMEYRIMANASSPYGDGMASDRIVKAILHRFRGEPKPDRFAPNETHLRNSMK